MVYIDFTNKKEMKFQVKMSSHQWNIWFCQRLSLIDIKIVKIIFIKEWVIETVSRCYQSWMVIKGVPLEWGNQVIYTVTDWPFKYSITDDDLMWSYVSLL